MHPGVEDVTARLIERSRPTRTRYLQQMQAAGSQGPRRDTLACANLAHGLAGCPAGDKQRLRLPGQQAQAAQGQGHRGGKQGKAWTGSGHSMFLGT